MTDFRAMCAELLEWAEHTSSHYYKQADVIVRARALLAQPEPPGSSCTRPASLTSKASGCRSINPLPRPPSMSDLSPAAQAVLDAFFASDWEDEPLHANIAAALRKLEDILAQVEQSPCRPIWSEPSLLSGSGYSGASPPSPPSWRASELAHLPFRASTGPQP
jgi:hypothetical protein